MNDFHVNHLRRLYGLTEAQARTIVGLHFAELEAT